MPLDYVNNFLHDSGGLLTAVSGNTSKGGGRGGGGGQGGEGGGERKRKRSAFKSKTRCGSRGRRGDDGEVGESEMVTVLFEGALIK